MMRLYLLKVFVILIISIEGKRSQFTLLRAIFPRAYGSTKENNTNFLQEEADCQTNSSYDMMVWKKLLLSEGWSCLLTPPSKNALYSTLLQLKFFLQRLILKFVNEHHNKIIHFVREKILELQDHLSKILWELLCSNKSHFADWWKKHISLYLVISWENLL